MCISAPVTQPPSTAARGVPCNEETAVFNLVSQLAILGFIPVKVLSHCCEWNPTYQDLKDTEAFCMSIRMTDDVFGVHMSVWRVFRVMDGGERKRNPIKTEMYSIVDLWI